MNLRLIFIYNKMDNVIKHGVIDINSRSITIPTIRLENEIKSLVSRFPRNSKIFLNVKVNLKKADGSTFVLKDPRTNMAETLFKKTNIESAVNSFVRAYNSMIDKLTDASSASDVELSGIESLEITCSKSLN